VPDIRIEQLPSGVWLAALSGELDFTGAESLRTEFEALLPVATKIVIDLTDATLLDSATIGVLAEVLLQAERRATEVLLVAAPGSAPDRILTVVGLSQLMKSTYATREAALEAFHEV
jgi:anti-anti-sigma factor